VAVVLGVFDPAPRIEDWVGSPRPANTTDCGSALLQRAETAVRPAAATATVNCAPWIWIVGECLPRGPCRGRGRWNNEGCQQNRRKTHESSPTMNSEQAPLYERSCRHEYAISASNARDRH